MLERSGEKLFVAIVIIFFCKKVNVLEEELRRKKFNTLNFGLENILLQKLSKYSDCFSSTLKMNDIIEVKYALANTSVHETEPKEATSGSAGYDLFATEQKTLFLRSVTPVTIELIMEIPCGYFGKVNPRSSLLKKYFVSSDAAVTDSDFRGSVLILITNNSNHPLLFKAGQRLAQIVFHKKEEVV